MRIPSIYARTNTRPIKTPEKLQKAMGGAYFMSRLETTGKVFEEALKKSQYNFCELENVNLKVNGKADLGNIILENARLKAPFADCKNVDMYKQSFLKIKDVKGNATTADSGHLVCRNVDGDVLNVYGTQEITASVKGNVENAGGLQIIEKNVGGYV